MTEPQEMDDYKTRHWGARFGYRTPPPEFAKSHTEPLSPLLGPAMSATKNEDVIDHQLSTNTLTLPSITSAPSRESLFSSYSSPSRFTPSSIAVNYASMDPMQLFADIALSTAPASFMATRSSPVSHALAAPPPALRSPSIPSGSNMNGVFPAWAADGYPTRNGNRTAGYPTTNPAPHAMVSDNFRETAYTYERRNSAVRLEPPVLSLVTSKNTAPVADGSLFSLPRLPEVTARAPLPTPFAPATSVFAPVEPRRKHPRKDAKNTTRGSAEAREGAGSTRDPRGSRSSGRGRSSSSRGPNPRKGRVGGSAPTKESVGLDKPSRARARPESLGHKIVDVVVTNGKPTHSSPIRLNRFPVPAVESNDPPSPSPAYSPFPSRPASPVHEATYVTPPVSEEVGRVGEVLQEVIALEAVSPIQEPEVELSTQGHIPSIPQADKISTHHTLNEQTSKNVPMEDVQSTVLEVLVEGNINKISSEVPEDVEKIVAIYSKPQESPDGGVISNYNSVMGDLQSLDKEAVPPAEDIVVELDVVKEPETILQESKAPAAESLESDNIVTAVPIAANDESIPMEEDYEIHEGLPGDASAPTSYTTVDASNNVQFVESEDYEIAHAEGDEPIFGAGVDACGVPHEAFDSVPATVSPTVDSSEGPKELRVLSPSGGLSREPENPDEEFCAHCDAKYRNGYGFRLDISSWIGCDGCRTWYHSACVGLDGNAVRRIDKYYCHSCEPKHGKSTMKRTSAREKTAIDYNALHNGSSAPIKNPTDSKLHPYVAIIRDRTHTFADDTLPRMRPDQVTEETIEGISGGWNQPFVVPAVENPAPWINLTNVANQEKELEAELMDVDEPELEPVSIVPTESPMRFPPPPSPQPPPPPPPPPPRSSRDSSPEKKSKRSKTGTPEMTLDSGNFDQTEVNRIRSTLVDGEYDVKERRAGADCLDMIIPEGLTVRKVGELIGAQMRVEMINVLRQSTTRDDKWHMENLVEYFESRNRDEIYNCISCEVTKTSLGAMISRPEVVRKMDLSDRVWRPANDQDSKPHVGKYVLMSVADSFTDFHIDFAGSSVFYHIYEGQKVFLVLPPTDKNLETYEQWSMDPNMNTTFFPTLVDDPCMLVTLNKGDTLFIPSGWIHAVYTPQDSLVIGGNFLTRSHYTKQMSIQRIEVVTDTKLSQRYPKYTTLMWHCLYNYLITDPIPDEVDRALAAGRIIRQKKFRSHKDAPQYTKQELEGLPDLCNFLLRTALIHCGSIKTSLRPGKPMLTGKQIDSVKRAIPAPCNEDPLKWVKRFGRWCVWKRASQKIEEKGERVPEWAQGKWMPEEGPKKGPSAAALKRIERKKAEEARRAEAPRRPGLRVRNIRDSTESTESEEAVPGPSNPQAVAVQAVKPAAKKKRKSEGDAEIASSKKKGRPTKVPITPQTQANSGSAATWSLQEGVEPTTSKKRKGKGKGKEKKPADSMDGESYALSDGAVYVAKESNLGPARAGCQNCRLKKTGCKHKAEISELLAILEANDGVLPPGTMIAGNPVIQLPKGTGTTSAKKKTKGKGKGKGKAVIEEPVEVEDDAEEEFQEEGEEEDEEDEEEEQVAEVSEKKDSEEPDDDWDLEDHVMEGHEHFDNTEGNFARSGSRRSSAGSNRRSSAGSSSNKKSRPVDNNGDDDVEDVEELPRESPPKKTKVIKEVLTTPAANVSGVAGRPPGFQGRKPSCEECKALKTKCLHDTWYLAKAKTPAKTVKNSRRKSGGRSARTVSKKVQLVADDTDQASPSGANGEGSGSMDIVDFEDVVQMNDEQEELEEVIVCKKPTIVTPAVKATAAAVTKHDTLPVGTPALTSVALAAAGPATAPRSHGTVTPPPRTASTSSIKSSPLSEPNTFDLDLSILDEQLLYKSRSSDTPDDPAIMAPPVDYDDEPPAQLPARATPNGVTPAAPVTTATVSNSVTAAISNYPKPAYRVNRPKVTYTRTNKNFKRKADEDESMDGIEIHNNKQARTRTSASPGAERSVGSVGGEDSPTVEELMRLGAAAEFGLRRRAGS